ncbi:MAG TPA: hypothetical protein VJN94_12250, partial [Candidatus Binataceae bacterium]|nr:hypothetical protein [Candidatus Binataceae bacterium]
MPKATWGVIALAGLIGASAFACRGTSWKADPSAVFFPLEPNMMWMYKIDSQSQRQKYVITDMVVGRRYVPALKLTGAVVEEFYNLDRAGLRPIVYTEK